MALARVFQSGNSQAVRLPKDYRVNARELEILRRGNEIVLRPRRFSLRGALELLARLPPDALTGPAPAGPAPAGPAPAGPAPAGPAPAGGESPP